MTIVTPTPPLVPDVVNFARPGTVVPNITPFTYRDGITYLEFLEALSTYVKDTITPFMNESFDALELKWGDDMEGIVFAVNAAMSAQTTAINTALDVQRASVNTALADQQETVDGQLASNATAMADLAAGVNSTVNAMTEFVNTEVTDLTTFVNSTAFQDANVRAIINTTNSATRTLLDTLYASAGGAVSDAAVAALVNNATSSTRTSLDTLYGADPDPVVKPEVLAHMRIAAMLGGAKVPGRAKVMIVGTGGARPATNIDPNVSGFGKAIRSLFTSYADSGCWFEPPVLFPTAETDYIRPGVRVYNYAGGAHTITDYIDSATATKIAADDPTVFVHMSFLDAIKANQTPAAFVTAVTGAMNEIETALTTAPAAAVHIVVTGVLPSTGTYTNTTTAYTDALKAIQDANPDMLIADVGEIFAYNKADSNVLGLFKADGLTLSEQGYEAIAQGIGNSLEVSSILDTRLWWLREDGKRAYQAGPFTITGQVTLTGQAWADAAAADDGWLLAQGISTNFAPATGDRFAYVRCVNSGYIYGEFSARIEFETNALIGGGIYMSIDAGGTDVAPVVSTAYRVEFVRNPANAGQWQLNSYSNSVKTTLATVTYPSASAYYVKMQPSERGWTCWLNGEIVLEHAAEYPQGIGQIGLFTNALATGKRAFFSSIGYRG